MVSPVVDRFNGLVGDYGIKAPCRVATTAAITLVNLQTVDGVALAAGDRVLVKDQADNTTNGIYAAQDSAAWVRESDCDGAYRPGRGDAGLHRRGHGEHQSYVPLHQHESGGGRRRHAIGDYLGRCFDRGCARRHRRNRPDGARWRDGRYGPDRPRQA